MLRKVSLGFEIWNLRRKQKKYANELKKLFSEIRNDEVVPYIIDERDSGIICEGLAAKLVTLANEFSKDTGFSFEMSVTPKFHWWNKLLIRPSRIRLALAKVMRKKEGLYIQRAGNLVLLLSLIKRLISLREKEYSKI